jgi:hypothetical protein
MKYLIIFSSILFSGCSLTQKQTIDFKMLYEQKQKDYVRLQDTHRSLLLDYEKTLQNLNLFIEKKL